ncbi:MAG: leucine-rich repeat domain-containing protein [Oscillatoriales cyanobacterium]|nr:MAG: leucine-rich repeat domain-containing protein [Oscillatoriales cyanobacterium]TAH20324.1 MAG: leucine-rich repeat domain-containing protein [Oscillatoriales cyanobacterium]
MTREELLQLIDKAADEGWTELDLAGLELEELPAQIGKCTQLETLLLGKLDKEKRKMVGNKLTEFPDVVLQLTNLKILNLSHNQITAIPEAIAQLSNLTQLDLSFNQITVIPEAIAQLSNLTQLDLSFNQITVIPEAIRGMEKLKKLHLRGNPLPIPPEILQGDLRTILDFYFQTASKNLCKSFLEEEDITALPSPRYNFLKVKSSALLLAYCSAVAPL